LVFRAGDQLALSWFFTGASILSNNTVVITGTSLDDAPNTYQCTFTDVEGRVTTSSGGQDGERVLDDNTVTCGTLPTGMAIRVIPWGTDEGNEPMIQAVVGLRRRDSAGNWQPVSFAPDSTVAERSVATNACTATSTSFLRGPFPRICQLYTTPCIHACAPCHIPYFVPVR